MCVPEPSARVVRDQLSLLRLLYDECLESMTLRPGSPAMNLSRRPVRGAGGPYAVLVDIRRRIVDVLAEWADMIVDERALPHQPAPDIADLTRFLAAHADWLLAHSSAPDFVEEIDDLERMTLAAVERDAGDPVGSCPEPGCGAALRFDWGTGTSRVISCMRGHSGTVANWVLRVRGESPAPTRSACHRMVPTKAAALVAGVPEATIRQWAHRGRLRRYGSNGRPKYDLDEVLAIACGGER
ncbi:helix-turn-helix domain-containing protein [Nocardia transvalensis]|uniref:helix-turn-helix domain-containing protein n=1 Tax=Nocardia transvalensis TaxID=37333 RepID=UPI001894E5B3|nr:helix-turn-helix domain-containing protein [Nocardia transvalensis]MBF6331952.1 helix-turn-helix domain-containing protein [Nocardia transvalensis]